MKNMITSYGLDNFFTIIAVAIVLIVAGVFINHPASWGLIIAGAIIGSFALWFFRNPSRTIPQEAKENHSILISPADGKIIQIIEIDEPFYMKEKTLRLSIFLSAFDVHVNRNPMTGIIEYITYNPGDYFIASLPKASELNENTKIGVKNPDGKRIMYKQMTGIMARRIVYDVKEGDSINVGEQFGMMKFGSRMDIFMPLGTELTVKLGDKVRGGETVVAKLK